MKYKNINVQRDKIHSQCTVEKPNLVPLDTIQLEDDIPRSLLDIENKTRCNLLPWRGQFSPQLIDILLEKYSDDNFTVLDPFLGSGTVVVECGRRKLECVGCEINLAAFYLSSIYKFINIQEKRRKEMVNDLSNIIHDCILNSIDFFYTGDVKTKSQKIQERLIKLYNKNHEETIKILLRALIILLDFYKEDTTNEKVSLIWNKIKKNIFSTPYSEKPIEIFNCDARRIPINNQIIDLVITSPPYINVFNYHQQYRASAEALGCNLLKVAKSEIGSNRKHRGNRFLTVIQYILDMYDCFLELRRVCKPSGKIIFIIGKESNVRKTNFYNGEIIASIAEIAGMYIDFRQERVFTNRFGQSIFEDILHFRNGNNPISTNEKRIRDLSTEILINALNRAPNESVDDLSNAIEYVNNVKRSPIYNSNML